MPRTWSWKACWGVCLLVAAGAVTAQAAQSGVKPSEKLLPKTTAGFLAVADYDKFVEHWDQTQWGKLMADAQMKPFEKDLRRQLQQKWSGIRDRLGLALEDLEGVPGGEVAAALIRPAPNQSAVAVLVDVTGKLPKAQAMLQKVSVNLVKSGAKQAQLDVGGTAVTVYELPPRAQDDPSSPLRKSHYFLSGNLLGVADSLEIVKGILARTAADPGDSLAELPGYQAVIKQVQTDAGHPPAQVRWFIHPLTYAEAMRTATPERERRKGKSALELLQHQGFSAVQGVGGMADFSAESYELIHRTAVFAPPPYEKAMKMLSFPNGYDFKPQPWVPREIATYATFYADILNGFDNFGPLFEEMFGEGEKGTWSEVLKSLKDDPNGPRIDLRADLFVHLGKRVTVLSDYQVPITTTSERLLFAVETSDPKAVAAAIEKLMKNDRTARRQEILGHTVWEIIEEPPAAVPKIDLGDVPSLTPGAKKKDEDEPEPARLLPHAAVTVAHGQLLIASHLDFLKKILKLPEERETLAHSLDFRVVTTALDQLGIKEQFLRTFSRTDEEYRPTYELIRQDKMPESETMLSRFLNSLSGESSKKGGPRKQQIDGSKLPDFEVVRRYLGPAGIVGRSEPTGWFLKGIMLSKEAGVVAGAPAPKTQ